MAQLVITVHPDGSIDNLDAARQYILDNPQAIAVMANFYRQTAAAATAAEAAKKEQTNASTDH